MSNSPNVQREGPQNSQFSQQNPPQQLSPSTPQSPATPNQPGLVRELAYRLWVEAGCPEAEPERFWLDAEVRVKRNANRTT